MRTQKALKSVPVEHASIRLGQILRILHGIRHHENGQRDGRTGEKIARQEDLQSDAGNDRETAKQHGRALTRFHIRAEAHGKDTRHQKVVKTDAVKDRNTDPGDIGIRAGRTDDLRQKVVERVGENQNQRGKEGQVERQELPEAAVKRAADVAHKGHHQHGQRGLRQIEKEVDAQRQREGQLLDSGDGQCAENIGRKVQQRHRNQPHEKRA